MGLCLGVPAADDKGAHEAFEMKKVYSKKQKNHFTSLLMSIKTFLLLQMTWCVIAINPISCLP